MKISIPSPCHEDWQSMTPTDKGAFCGVCTKEVIDFTKKTNTEIRSILMAKTGEKICGNFLTIQLEDGYDSFTDWKNQSVTTFRTKFLWACTLAFGLTLFTGCESIPNQEQKVGEMEWVETDSSSTNCEIEQSETDLGELELTNTNDSTAAAANTGDFSITTQVKGDIYLP